LVADDLRTAAYPLNDIPAKWRPKGQAPAGEVSEERRLKALKDENWRLD
jgi:hypothetical protein